MNIIRGNACDVVIVKNKYKKNNVNETTCSD